MTSVSKNVYTDKLYDIVNKYNNTCHSTIKMKLLDVKSDTYIDFITENIEKNHKLKIVDIARISHYKKKFWKRLSSKLIRRSFVIKKVENTVPWTYVINDFNGQEIVGMFYKKEL